MSRSLIQTANQSDQAVALNSIIVPGSVQRRFGCNIRLSGNAIELAGDGYYTVDAGLTIAPTAAGDVSVALFDNGVQIPGAIVTGAGTAGAELALSLPPVTIRQRCCDGADILTLVLLAGPGTVSNVAIRVIKE